MKTLERNGKRLICGFEGVCKNLTDCGGCTPDGENCPFAKVEIIKQEVHYISKVCTKCGKIVEKANPFIDATKMIAVGECACCHGKPIVSVEMDRKFPHLALAVSELNAWHFELIDGWVNDFESAYKFKFKLEKGRIEVWDEKGGFAKCSCGSFEESRVMSLLSQALGKDTEVIKSERVGDLIVFSI